MKDFQGTRNWGSILRRRPALFIMGVLLLFFAFNVVVFFGKMQDTVKNRELALEKKAELEKAKVKLEADIASLNTEKGVEQNIREKFGFGKEGESLVIIIDEQNSDSSEVEVENKGFFSFFEKWFDF